LSFNALNNNGVSNPICGVDARNATFIVPDLWGRIKTRRLRLEAEAVYVNGNYTINDETTQNNVNHKVNVNEFGGAFQGEYKFLSDMQLSVGFDFGLATGNESYGFGIQPGRSSPFAAAPPGPGSIDGSSVWCPTNTEPCQQSNVNAFSFSRDYRIDQILWRQILGTVTDAWFAKPTIKYRFLPGLEATLSGIYSQAQRPQFTPGQQAPLGIEGDLGVHYATDDGFIANIDYGILAPLAGLNEVTPTANIGTSVAQSVRLLLGVKY
jgi:uncharacterized protein (TIGR04551 family)